MPLLSGSLRCLSPLALRLFTFWWLDGGENECTHSNCGFSLQQWSTSSIVEIKHLVYVDQEAWRLFLKSAFLWAVMSSHQNLQYSDSSYCFWLRHSRRYAEFQRPQLWLTFYFIWVLPSHFPWNPDLDPLDNGGHWQVYLWCWWLICRQYP